MKGLLVTDFDGTLSKGYISMDFMDYLYLNKLYDKASYEKQQLAIKDYHEKKITYDAWCDVWGIFWAEGMAGQNTTVITEAAGDFFKSFKKNIYSSSYDIISHLKKNHDILCLSVGASEVISLAANDLGIENSVSTRLDIAPASSGKYTGGILTNLHMPGGKEKFLRELGFKVYIGLGDSGGDKGFLEMAEVPILLNPSADMKEHAARKGWLVEHSTTSPKIILEHIDARIVAYESGKTGSESVTSSQN